MIPVPVTERLRRAALLIWATIGGVLLAAAVLWAASRVRIIWLPLAFAAGLVILLDPIVRALERARIPRVVGSLFAFLILAAFLVAVGFMVVPIVREQATELGDQLPDLYDGVVAWLQATGARFGIDPGPVWTSETIREWIQDPANQSALQDLIGGFGSGAGRLLRGFAEVVAVLGLAPMLAFYLLLDLPSTRRLAIELTPPRLREEVDHVAAQLETAVGAFVRGQLLVAFIVGAASSLALYLLGLPFWLIIGMATGLLNLVPLIGPFFGAGLAAMVALLQGEPGKAVAAVVIFTAIQQVDNHVITPMIQRARVRLSPLVIVLALIVGGSVAGLLGVLVAVPVVTGIRIVAGHWWRTRVLGESWAEASEAMIEVTTPPDRLRPRLRRSDQPRLFDTQEMEPVDDTAPEQHPVTVPPDPPLA